MKRAPKIGDLIMIGTSTKPMLVVEAEKRESVDYARGYADAYYATTFEVISEDKTGVVNPKTKKYVLAGGSMGVSGHTEIALEDLYLVDSIKMKKKVVTQVTYERKK